MSDGAATDRSRDEAWEQSRACRHCSGSGQVMVFRPGYDGRRVADMDCVVRGEVVKRPVAMTVAAHCLCPMGRWMRSKTDRELVLRIPDLVDVLAGRSRWLAEDPTGDEPGHEYRAGDARRMRAALGERLAAKGGVAR